MSAFGGKADIAFAQDCRADAQEIVTVELTPTNLISIGGFHIRRCRLSFRRHAELVFVELQVCSN